MLSEYIVLSRAGEKGRILVPGNGWRWRTSKAAAFWWQSGVKMSRCVGFKGSSTPVSFFCKIYFSKDVLEEFMLLCSFGDVLPMLNFCDYFYLSGAQANFL